MKKLYILSILVLGLVVSCSSSKNGATGNTVSITQDMVNSLTVSNLTWQEQVSGVQGGENMIVFTFKLNNNDTHISLDSLYYLDYACKLNLKNQATGMYVGRSFKSKSQARTKELKSLVFTLNNSDLNLSVSETELNRLEPLYMP